MHVCVSVCARADVCVCARMHTAAPSRGLRAFLDEEEEVAKPEPKKKAAEKKNAEAQEEEQEEDEEHNPTSMLTE